MASGVELTQMLIAPQLAVTRFAQLRPGDLFIYPYGEDAFVALKVMAPDGDMLFMPMGPGFPDGLTYPRLLHEPAATVISFGKDYILRLPTRPKSWRSEPPPAETHCIVMAEDGAYVRASFVPEKMGYRACYVALGSGTIATDGSSTYSAPRGHMSFALEWEMLTQEAKPRQILAYPW